MKRSAKTVLRRAGIALAGLLLLVIGTSVFLLGTETGTRWTLRQAIRFAPGELVVEEFRGTFLEGLMIPAFSYTDAATQLNARGLMIRVDWFRSSLDRVHLAELAADEIRYRNLGSARPAPRALEISMPPLPIRLGVSELDVRALHVDDTVISEITARNAVVRGNRISADSALAQVSGIAVEVSDLRTVLADDVPVSAGVAWTRTAGSWSGRGRVSGSLAELGFYHELSGSHPATAEGKAFLLGRLNPEVDATVRFDHWTFGRLDISEAEVRLRGTTEAYRAGVDAAVTVRVGAEKFVSAVIAGEASGDLEGLQALEVTANGAHGQIAANGELAWLPEFSTDLEVQAQDLDPSRFVELPAGQLNAMFRMQLRNAGDFALQVASLDGVYNGENARAAGSFSRSGESWRCEACNFSLGRNRVAMDGELASGSVSAKLKADAPDLSMLWPGLAGALTADAQLRGSTALPILSGHALGKGVKWGSWSVESFDLASRSSTVKNVDLDVRVEGLARDDSGIGSGSANLSGTVDAIDVELQWLYGEMQASADALIVVGDRTFSARVQTASLAEPWSGTWRMADPATLSAGPGLVEASANSWLNGGAVINLSAFSIKEGQLTIGATLAAMPLATLNVALPPDVRLQGYADAEFELLQGADGVRTGLLQWTQRETTVRITPPGDEAIDILVPVASAELQFAGAGAAGRASLEIEPGVRGSLDFSIEGFSPDSPMSARVRLDGTDWSWIPAFFPEIDNFQGMITADITAGGSLAAPELEGDLRWQDGSIAVPALNVPLTGIDIVVTGSSAGSASIAGRASAGSGELRVDGRFEDLTRASRSFTVTMSGKEATVLNWPDYRLVASPDLRVSGGPAGVQATGRVFVDSAEISVSEVPEGAVSPSSDVTVEGREEIERNVIPVTGRIELELSEDVHINAFGLDTNVEGQLRFTLREGRDPRAQGALKLVDGVFSAYGQRLTIEEGTMTFTGPLDDPVIYVRAIREIESLDGTIKAGIELRGRAQNLSSSVFSNPSMSEADALSYLVLGYPLEDASAADGSRLSGTAYALGLRQATVITNQIGQTLGLDQLAVSGNNQSTTALIAGKQVSSRMYVRYAYGVFSQIGNLLLRYKLSKRLTIEAGTGAESQSMDLLYLVEKP